MQYAHVMYTCYFHENFLVYLSSLDTQSMTMVETKEKGMGTNNFISSIYKCYLHHFIDIHKNNSPVWVTIN
jgi:hypothetical protein